MYIQSVIEGSPASESGINPDMTVMKIDKLDFSENPDLCAYMEFMENKPDTIHLVLKDKAGEIKNFGMVKKYLTK